MIWEIGTVVKHVVLPPVGLAWPLAAALWLMGRRPRLARALLLATLAVFVAMAVPLVAEKVWRQVVVAGDEGTYGRAQAIVVLGGGRYLRWSEDGNTVLEAGPGPLTLERLHGGARLARRTGLPVLVTAGNPDGQLPTEAEVMRRTLVEDYGIVPRWIEDRSRNTAENAEFSARILRGAGVRTVLLVTSDFHMRRSLKVFRDAGLDPLPVPVPPVGNPNEFEWQDLLPNARSLMVSHYAIHEMAGWLYSAARAASRPSATVGN